MFSNKQTKKNDLMVQQRINAVNNFSSNNSWYNIRHTCVHQKTERRENWEKIKREPKPKKKNCIPRGSYRVHITFFERLNRSLGYWNYMSSRLTLVASKIWTTTKQKNDKYDTNIWTYKEKKKKKRRRNAGQCDSMEWPIILHSIFHCFMLCPFACYRTWIIVRKTRSGVFYIVVYILVCCRSSPKNFASETYTPNLYKKKTMQMLNKPQQSKVVTSAELLHRTSRNFITDTD